MSVHSESTPLPPPASAFAAIDPGAFDAAAARHLLRRMGYAATPRAVETALQAGVLNTVTGAYARERPMPRPADIARFDEGKAEFRKTLRGLSEKERKEAVEDVRRKRRQIFTEYGVHWLTFAREPENSVQEKAVAWLQDILVVGAQKVDDPAQLFDYQATLRHGLYGDYPALLRAVLRQPAMIRYLDLSQSRVGAPNENFARELCELFSLGEGTYTEQDVKEIARALTGVVLAGGNDFRFDARRHDTKPKTIFGKTGDWGLDEVIDLIAAHPAFPTFVARDFLRYFVSWEALPQNEAYAVELGKIWKTRGFKITELPKIVFCSRLFYAPSLRGERIKSPQEYYLGLCQDLNIDTVPFPGPVLGSLRAMGQTFYDPPNVRGWIAGRNWINSSTLSARRQVARTLFNPVNEKNLNADDKRALDAAIKAGHGRFTVTDDRLRWLAENRTNEEIARHLSDYFLPVPVSDAFRKAIVDAIPDSPPENRLRGLRETVVALLQSPLYQLS